MFLVISIVLAVAAFLIYNVKKKDSRIITFIVEKGWYTPVHLTIAFFCVFLGSFGKQVVNKSAGNMMASVGTKVVQEAKAYKTKLFESLKKDWTSNVPTILEIGAGSGANFDFYPEKCKIHVCEPEVSFQGKLALKISEKPGFELLGIYPTGAENLSQVPDNSVDVVIGTKVLCCVTDIPKVLGEIKRVLKIGGKYYFTEHVRDQSNPVRRAVHDFLTVTSIWAYQALNCGFKDCLKFIEKEGFKIEELFEGAFPVEKAYVFWICQPVFHGVARTVKN